MQSNPCNIGKQPRQPWRAMLPATLLLRHRIPPLSTLCVYRNLLFSSSPHRIPANPSPLSCLTHASLTRRSDPVTLYTTPHSDGRRDTIYIPATGSRKHRGREVRNLFCGRRATAAVGMGIQPRLQVKTISVALPTARQNAF